MHFRPGTPAAPVYQVSGEWTYGPGVGWDEGKSAGSMDWCGRWDFGMAQTLGFRTGTHTLALRPGTPAARVYQVSEEWPYGPGVGWDAGESAGSMDWYVCWAFGRVQTLAL